MSPPPPPPPSSLSTSYTSTTPSSATLHFDHPALTKLVTQLSTSPDSFLPTPSSSSLSSGYDTIIQALPLFYQFIKQHEPKTRAFGPMPQLHVNGFDSEQIWAQIHTLNTHLLDKFIQPQLEVFKVETVNTNKKKTQSVNEVERGGSEEEKEEEEEEEEEDFEFSSENENDMDEDDDDKVDEEEVVDSDNNENSLKNDSDASDTDNSDNEQHHDLNTNSNNLTPSHLNEDDDDSNEENMDDPTYTISDQQRDLNQDQDLDLDPTDPFGFHEEDQLAKADEDSDFLDEDEANDLDEKAAQCLYTDFFGDAPPQPNSFESTVDALDESAASLPDKVAHLFLDVIDDDDVEGEEEEEDNDDNLDGLAEPNAFHSTGTEETKNMSTFEKQNAKIQKQIEALELEALEEKKWTLKGEVTSRHRPLNSLLEEVIDFDCVREPVPVISESFTHAIEDMILARIKANRFDDVEAPEQLHHPSTPYQPKQDLSVSDEKSKLSLAEVYEQAYVDHVSAHKQAAVVEALTQQHEEIQQLQKDLFYQLDALANYFYTPPPPPPPTSALSAPNVPAIALEESIPSHVSDASLKAPKEIFQPSRQWKGQAELSASDKSQLRKKAKKNVRTKKLEKEKIKAVINKQKEQLSSTHSSSSVINKVVAGDQ